MLTLLEASVLKKAFALSNQTLNLIVFASGNGSNFEAIQKAIEVKDLDAKIHAVICDKKDAYVLTRAENHNIPTHTFTYSKQRGKVAFEKAIVNTLKDYPIDYIVCAGYMRIIGPTILKQYKGRIVNIHPSDLPKYKGINALDQALDAGEKNIGVSVHYVDETLDGGEIIEQIHFGISDDMTRIDIEQTLHYMEHALYIKVLKDLQREKKTQL